MHNSKNKKMNQPFFKKSVVFILALTFLLLNLSFGFANTPSNGKEAEINADMGVAITLDDNNSNQNNNAELEESDAELTIDEELEEVDITQTETLAATKSQKVAVDPNIYIDMYPQVGRIVAFPSTNIPTIKYRYEGFLPGDDISKVSFFYRGSEYQELPYFGEPFEQKIYDGTGAEVLSLGISGPGEYTIKLSAKE
ncbi:MAG: hypothetical protein ACRCUS_10440, partial [Anaerovoracaceae bacterium]